MWWPTRQPLSEWCWGACRIKCAEFVWSSERPNESLFFSCRRGYFADVIEDNIMRYAVCLLCTFLLIAAGVWAQVLPVEGSQLHYRMVGFSAGATSGATEVEVAEGNWADAGSFEQHIVVRVPLKAGRGIGLVPAFGKVYTWRAGRGATDLHHFSTGGKPGPDLQHTRLNVIKQAMKYADGYVFCDGSRTLYDMHGNAIWYLPDMAGIVGKSTIIRDMKMTSRGTITLLANDVPYELSYDGRVIWTAPHNNSTTGDTAEKYHHELTRLSNGHYMVLGTETVRWEWRKNAKGDSSLYMPGAPGGISGKVTAFEPMAFSTLLELDEKGRLVWWWKSSDYYREHAGENKGTIRNFFDPHGNAFSVDERGGSIYVSFKNINQVFRVSYPGKRVTGIYGSRQGYGVTNMPGVPYAADISFCEQHSCKKLKDGGLCIFNNNICHPLAPPTVLVADATKAGAKKIWEYTYPLDVPVPRPPVTKGGNVQELPGGSLLVSFCTPYNNLFIVDRKKQLLWDALLEQWNPDTQTWGVLDEYRASYVPGAVALAGMVWYEFGIK